MPITFADSTIHVGDVGTDITGTVKGADGITVSVGDVQGIEFIFQKPDDTLLNTMGSLVTDGLDGKIHYATVDGDIDQSGTWKLQIKLTFVDTVFFSNVIKFKVFADLPI